MATVKETCEKWGKEHGICVTPSQLIEQLQANLEKYGRHLRSCELSKQPKFTSTDTRWKCTCGLSIAIGCDLCGSTGYLVGKERIYKGGFYYTGHCPKCGKV